MGSALMVKEYTELSKQPEYPERAVVQEFVEFVIDNAVTESRNVTICKLRELADKQYHTYEKPSKELVAKIEKYLTQNWADNSEKFLEDIMVIAVCFCLHKDLFGKALEKYKGKGQREFQLDYEHPDGCEMNPWWDLKK
jgi:hypothetical protein